MYTILNITSFIFDMLSTIIAIPFLSCGFLCQCGPYDGIYDTPSKNNPEFITDRWYKSSIHTLHGGSFLQLLATSSIYWRFPLISKNGNQMVLGFMVRGKNRFGRLFAKLIEKSNPTFRVKILKPNIWSVRLNIGETKLSGTSLNDVWKIHKNGSIITSVKTRGRFEYYTCGLGTGPAMFVESFDEADNNTITTAIMERF